MVQRLRLRIGDVFTVPVGDELFALGQVVARFGRSNWLFAVFDTVFDGQPHSPAAVREAIAQPVKLLGLSMDAKLYVGDWKVVGHHPVSPAIPLPGYKVSIGDPDNAYVEDFLGDKSRPATSEEQGRVPYRTVVSLIIFELAFRSSLGLEPWVEIFDSIDPANVVPSSTLFPEGGDR